MSKNAHSKHKKSVFKLCRSHTNKKNVRSFTAINTNHMKIVKKKNFKGGEKTKKLN